MNPKETQTLNKFLPDWKSLDYNSAGDLVAALQTLRQELYPKWIEVEKKKYERDRNKREKSKENFDLNIAPKILDWVQKNLKPGDIVKFDGCRDRGYREVIEVNLKTKTVLCWQLNFYHGNKRVKEGFKRTGLSTENSISKIKKVFVNWGEGEWTDIKDLI